MYYQLYLLPGGDDTVVKISVDASLESWMAMNKSLDCDLDLPSTLAGVESLLAAGMFNSGGRPRVNGGIDNSLLGLGSLGILDKSVPQFGAATTGPEVPDNAPAQVPGLTMGVLREQFAKFLRQGNSSQEMEAFLRNHGLLPVDKRGEDGENREEHGLESMKSIENNLPTFKEENSMSGVSG